MHTLWSHLLLERSLDLFNTLQICYRHIEDVHEEDWCRKIIFLTNLQGLLLSHFSMTTPSNWWLIVYTLWNQLLLELSLDLFNTLQIWYRHIEDVHEEVWCRKIIFLTNLQGLLLSHFSMTTPSNWWLIVYTLWNQLLLELSLDLWRYVADILKMCMKKFDAEKYFLTNLQGFYFSHFFNTLKICMLQTYWRCAWRNLMQKKYLMTNSMRGYQVIGTYC